MMRSARYRLSPDLASVKPGSAAARSRCSKLRPELGRKVVLVVNDYKFLEQATTIEGHKSIPRTRTFFPVAANTEPSARV
jgi:hypothetical protein